MKIALASNYFVQQVCFSSWEISVGQKQKQTDKCITGSKTVRLVNTENRTEMENAYLIKRSQKKCDGTDAKMPFPRAQLKNYNVQLCPCLPQNWDLGLDSGIPEETAKVIQISLTLVCEWTELRFEKI